MHFVSDCQEPEHVRHCVLMVQAELKKGSEYLLNTLLLRYSFALNLIQCKQANMHDQIRFPYLHSSDEHSEMLRFQIWYKIQLRLELC